MEEHLKKLGYDTLGPLGFPVSDKQAKEIDSLLETGEYGYFKLTRAGEFDGLYKSERSEISLISDDSVDQDGEIFPPEKLDFSAFEKYGSPVFYNHRYDLLPVGRALWLKKSGNGFRAKTQYIERPENYPKDKEWLPESVWHLVQKSLLRGKSIGGIKKMRPITTEDLQKNPNWNGGRKVAEKAIIYEYSVCPKGCNSNAIVEEVVKSLGTLPSSMLEDFPELLTKLKKSEEEIPLLKSSDFITKEDYLEKRNILISNHIHQLKEQLPQLVEEHIRRLAGKVT